MGALGKVFAVCLVGGLGFAILMGLSAGLLARLRLPRPKVAPRLRLLRVRLPFRRPGRLPGAPAELTLFPPGTLPIMAGLFATLFGAGGLVCQAHLRWGAAPSFLGAAAFATVGTVGLAWALWRFLLSSSHVSELRGGTLFGKIGHVSVAIPEHGLGAVAYVAQGKRMTLPAKSRTGLALPRGTKVMLVDLDGQRVVVDEFDPGL
jgi:membrane protein implicated in regulation of membrane protease activity